MRVLACIGDATSARAHGGLPYHLLDAGKKAGFIDAGWPLQPEKLSGARLWWNVRRLLTDGEYGGYQYTDNFLRALVSQAPVAWSRPDEIISIFPLLPPPPAHRANVSIYIDATIKQNFEEYGIAKNVGRGLISETLARERQAYREVTRIICRSTVAAKSVVEDYGIDARKVHIVPGGANIIGDPGTSCYGPDDPLFAPLRLGFIGKDWRRKNLPFLLKIAETLSARGIAVEVVAAGFDPEKGPRHPLLRAIGFIDKQSNLRTFVDVIRSCHFSCLFSIAEAFGLSNRESLRLGVPVLASNIGGIPDTVPQDCGHLFVPDAVAADIADIVEAYVQCPDSYRALRDAVAARAEEFTWTAAVAKMQEIWAGSEAYHYQSGIAPHA